MNFEDLVYLVSSNLRLRKNRTLLTVIGVVIGSTCIFTLLSLGQGLRRNTIGQFESLGDVKSISVFRSPNNSNSTKKAKAILDDKSINQLKKIQGVSSLAAKLSVPFDRAYFNDKPMQCSITGTDFNSKSSLEKLLYGKYPGPNENKIIIGFNLACSFLDLNYQDERAKNRVKSILNKSINIEYSNKLSEGESNLNVERLSLEICGITKEDSKLSWEIYLPMNASKRVYKSVHNDENKVQYSSIDIICDSIKNVSNVEKNILKLGYTTYSLFSVKASLNKIMTLITMFLGFLGSISLLISSFGIMNTMNMSILERKKEIGIIKVLGANISSIKKIFVSEALVIGFVGGFIGIFIGFFINFILNYIMRIYEFSNNESTYTNMFIVTPFLIIFTLVFSSLIGILSGLIPAVKASKLDVINALKDE